MIRAFNPWPVAFTKHDGKTMRIWEAEILDQSSTLPPGSVENTSSAGIDVATGSQQLRITQLQPQGKRAMAAKDFFNAHDLTGHRFG